MSFPSRGSRIAVGSLADSDVWRWLGDALMNAHSQRAWGPWAAHVEQGFAERPPSDLSVLLHDSLTGVAVMPAKAVERLTTPSLRTVNG